MSEEKKSGEVETITINIMPFIMPVTILLSVIIFSTSFLLGMNSIADGLREGGTGTSVKAKASDSNDDKAPTAEVADPAPTVDTQNTSVSIDDDPYLGDKDSAKVAIVEFTDYECPFCQRHQQQTKNQIMENFVETGDAIYVERDFPLSFHGQQAIDGAIAVECVQEQKGNEAAFEMIDLIFTNTGTNGAGVPGGRDTLADYAEQLGANKDEFKKCLEDQEFKDEVDADMADGTAAGVSGTPGFIVGTLDDDGNVQGVLISGAQPYATFEQAIEAQLEK